MSGYQFIGWNNTILIIGFIIILVVYVCFRIDAYRAYKNKTFHIKTKLIYSYPTVLSTIGVLFTFIGIVYGLFNFSTNDISNSITDLLGGMRMAFVTSIEGIVLSLIIGWRINTYADKLKNNEKLTTPSDNLNDTLGEFVNGYTKHMTSIGNMLSSMSEKLTSSTELQTKQLSILQSVVNNMQNLHTDNSKQSTILGEITSSLGTTIDLLDSQMGIQNETLVETKALAQTVKGEIVVITDAMEKSNDLMEKKFDEFSNLMRKNNVEALVEVMNTVTRQFNDQMKELINKLVQENFDQLNDSVLQLNTWQQDNKEHIKELTSQYSNMAIEFRDSSTILKEVAQYSNELVKEDSKLQKLILELQRVIIDDDKFTQIVNSLEGTISKVEQGTISFEESTKQLNTWINNHRDIGDGVRLLIIKLDEINQIKDYNEQFWQTTKKSLNEGLSIVVEASKSLDTNISTLNDEFYERLNTTLANLDSCIQAMHNNYSR